jgi:hypothetical protein
MPKYSVSGTITVGVYTDEVEADTPEQARQIARTRCVQGLCYHCSSGRHSDEKSNALWRLCDGLENNGEVEITAVLDEEGNEIHDGE